MYPYVQVREPLDHQGHFDMHAFRAVFVLIDPIYWGRELQIVMDVRFSPNRHLGRRTYVGDFHLPRYGAGAFHALLETLFTRTTGHKLKQILYGKPQHTSFAFTETILDAQHDVVERIYMVDDNLYTDIYGANQYGGRWKSVLTQTGMHPESANHEELSAYQVLEDVVEALDL
ncbi:hypothetical protein PsorP6_007656 [Peronosclerospora sorghi]|uniref:Uncharacterized protein n=1 Tax=Peronosclerospora sorghi TaxID=230839 RepID=A0ACC0WCB1_9STRA|nr:hypothetical protein PsorP6_007656 [Peronosclerospora sorghi]